MRVLLIYQVDVFSGIAQKEGHIEHTRTLTIETGTKNREGAQTMARKASVKEFTETMNEEEWVGQAVEQEIVSPRKAREIHDSDAPLTFADAAKLGIKIVAADKDIEIRSLTQDYAIHGVWTWVLQVEYTPTQRTFEIRTYGEATKLRAGLRKLAQALAFLR